MADISHHSRGWADKIKVLADVVLGGDSLPGLWTAAFLLCPHVTKRDLLSCVSSNEGTNPIHEGFILMI